MTKIAFLSMDSLDGFVCYDSLVIDRLHERGIVVDVVSWRAAVDWNQYSLVIQRSPWDYQQNPDGYLATLAAIDRSRARLRNSLRLSTWNIRKTYLRDLEQAGITIVPTLWIKSASVTELQALGEKLNCSELVVKPEIGANADHAFRLGAGSSPATWQAAAATYSTRRGLAQPFLSGILELGEISLIHFGGRFSHAVRKTPKTGDFRVQEEHGGIIAPHLPDDALLEFSNRCLAAIPEPALYARVDVVFLNTGQPAVMEIELLEPSLYLNYDPLAAARFADAIEAELAEDPETLLASDREVH